MEPVQEQIAALEGVVQELRARQGAVERQLRRWRGFAGALVITALVLQPLRTGKAAPGDRPHPLTRVAALQGFPIYRAPRVRRTSPTGTSSLTARVTMLERAVNYEEQQITSLGAALNQEIAARQSFDPRLPLQPPIAGQTPPAPAATGSPFTDAQTTTLRKLAGLLVISGGTIRCNGDLALTSGHALLANKIGPVDADARMDDHGAIEFSGTTRCYGDIALASEHRLLTNKIAPIDAQGRPDDQGTTEFSGNVSVAQRLSNPGAAKAPPSAQ